MTDETKPPFDDDKPKRVRKPKVPKGHGRPRRKSAKKREEAHQRVLDLIAARRLNDPDQRGLTVDCLVRTWIDHETLLAEPGLQDLMWVEYRYMTPLERTELFTQKYIDAYRRAYAHWCGSADEAARKKPCELQFARNDIGDMNCLWTARAHADALGVPYDMYLDAVMEGKLDNGKWIEPPLPNQLYAKIDPARLRDRPTAEEIGDRLFAPDWDARFFADAYRNDPVREAALALLRMDVRAAPKPATRLSEYMAGRRAITETRALAMFGDDLVDAAIAAGGPPDGPVPQDVAPYRPHCFGHPHALPQSPCWGCSFVHGCVPYAKRIAATLMATTGSDNPRLARERALAAERQRRWYARHKQASNDDCACE